MALVLLIFFAGPFDPLSSLQRTGILPIKLFSLILFRSHGVDGEEKSSDATSTKRRHEILLEALGDRKPKVYRFASSELEDLEVEYF